jgi:FlaG/FlaF family flagellin (archaellin)
VHIHVHEHGTISSVAVVLLVAVAAIIVGVVLAALGRAGELASAPADVAPVELGTASAADIAMFRPPMALVGYSIQATEDALQVIAQSVTERDVEIASLRQRLAPTHEQTPDITQRLPSASDRAEWPAEPRPPDPPQHPPLASDRADWPSDGVSGLDG